MYYDFYNVFFAIFLQKEAGKTMIEKFRQHAQEQKTKIEDLGIIQQKRGGKRKRKNYWKKNQFVNNTN